MQTRKLIVTSFASLLILIASSSAFACACCVNRGYYETISGRPNSFYTALLGDIEMTGPANLYLTEAGFDGIKGLSVIENDDPEGKLDVTASFAQKTWRFNVRSGTAHNGSLWLPLPAVLSQYRADIDGLDTGLGVSLFKEFKVTGSVSKATGIFRSANKGTKFTLLFQGRGNGCDDASDFNRWRLEINGPRADYAFFGKANP